MENNEVMGFVIFFIKYYMEYCYLLEYLYLDIILWSVLNYWSILLCRKVMWEIDFFYIFSYRKCGIYVRVCIIK